MTKYFKMLTTDTHKFSTCFKGTDSFPNQIKAWQNKLQSCNAQSFYKIRSKKIKFCESEVGELLERRKIIKLQLKAKPCEQKAFKKAKIEAKIAEAT